MNFKTELESINHAINFVNNSIIFGVCEYSKRRLLSMLNTIKKSITTKNNNVVNNIGEMSDGYHTFNELYHHRAILFAVVCSQFPHLAWKSLNHHDPNQPMYDGMFIVGINTPLGQATYHYDIDQYWNRFNVTEYDRAPEWDGHTPDVAIARIESLIRHDNYDQ